MPGFWKEISDAKGRTRSGLPIYVVVHAFTIRAKYTLSKKSTWP